MWDLPPEEVEAERVEGQSEVADRNFVAVPADGSDVESLQQRGEGRERDHLDEFVAHAGAPAAAKG